MAGDTYGRLFTVTTFGESHGPAMGCVVDGCPPGLALTEADIQKDLDRRRPGRSRHVTQRQEPDQVKILSGVFEGRTTGTAIGLLVENVDQKSGDYSKIKDSFRPGHKRLGDLMRVLFSGNKNNRSTGSLGGDQFLQFKAVQIRHLHVEYHAIGHER